MKVKTSISLSSDILEKVQTITSEGNRSDFIEKALWYYFDILQKDTRNKKDLEIINESATWRDTIKVQYQNVRKYT